jgi:hypothetical protein
MNEATRSLARSEPCRYCGEATYLADATGPLHPCCRFWIEEEGKSHCVACRAAKGLARWHQRSLPPADIVDPTTSRRGQTPSVHVPTSKCRNDARDRQSRPFTPVEASSCENPRRSNCYLPVTAGTERPGQRGQGATLNPPPKGVR